MWIRSIALANNWATLRQVRPGKFSGAGTVLVETTSLMASCDISFSTALPVNSPWVQATLTSAAPKSWSRWTISMIEPPVAISSSSTIARLPATSPTMASMTTLSSAIRCFEPAATGRLRRRDNRVACFALPRSGETTTQLVRSFSR